MRKYFRLELKHLVPCWTVREYDGNGKWRWTALEDSRAHAVSVRRARHAKLLALGLTPRKRR